MTLELCSPTERYLMGASHSTISSPDIPIHLPWYSCLFQFFPYIYLLVLNVRRVAGWVAGGCWDDYQWLWIIPENSLLSTSKFRNDMEIEMGGTSKINHPVDSRIFHHNHPYWGTFIDGNLYMYVHVYIYRSPCGSKYLLRKYLRYDLGD